MTTVHFIYPYANEIRTPAAIGHQVGLRLAKHYRVVHYPLQSSTLIRPKPGDILLGHPWTMPLTVFRRSIRQSGWRRRLIMCPYAHGDLGQCAFIDPLMAHCDQYLAITGRHWFRRIGYSAFAHWQSKMVHLDLAIDRTNFPPLKREFSPPGRRRFVYIGYTGRYKNTPYLSQIAQQLPEIDFAWVGGTDPCGIPGVKPLGTRDFSDPEARKEIGGYDFLLTVGRSDANPTTILEAMAWGLIPVCTPQSGYEDYSSIPNIPLDDLASAVKVIEKLQNLPDSTLRQMQTTNWQMLDDYFNWDRFTQAVIDAIESNASPPLVHESISHRLKLLWKAKVSSQHSPLRPINLASGIINAWRDSGKILVRERLESRD